MWQDIVFAIVNILFGYALIPQIIKGFKEKKANIALQSGIIFSTCSFILVFTMITLNLTFSAIIVFINSISWTILLCQTVRYKK